MENINGHFEQVNVQNCNVCLKDFGDGLREDLKFFTRQNAVSTGNASK
jgi:hypothetical protein